jgi:hypothetical protein
MSTYLGKMAGREVRAVPDAEVPAGRVLIAVGRSRLTESIDTSGLGCEQFITEVRPGLLAIVGGRRAAQPGLGARDAGTLYGVYEFLEGLGVRWYRPEPWGEHVPRRRAIRLEVGRTVSPAPSYLLRFDAPGGLNCYWHQTTEEEKDQGVLWAARNRLNFWDSSLDGGGNHYWYPGEQAKVLTPREAGWEQKLGGKEHYLWDHAYRYIMPRETYFATHPEYYALKGGKRDPSDLCLGNPEMQRVFAETLIAKAKANPHLSSISIEPDDCRGNSCECDLCKVMDLPLNTRPNGEGSNRVSLFGNLVARMVAKEAPWVKLQWLGYSGHTAAPTNLEQLEPNTIVMPAPIGEWDDWRRSLPDLAGSAFDLPRMLGEWAALKPSCLMVWEYYGGYAWPGPLPMAYSVADRWREYRQLGVKGIMNEGETSWGPQGLDRYMCVRLMWNPDLDVGRELNLYYANYYGPAAAPMKAYHEALYRAFARAKYPIWSGGHGMHLLFTPALVAELGRYMETAQARVKGQPLHERRLYGLWAGYEFARRVSEILVLKKRNGVPVCSSDPAGELSPGLARPAFGGSGNYLQSAAAEKAYRDLVRWVRSVNTGDHVFLMIRDQSKCQLQEDVAETVFPSKGWAESIWIGYLPYDLLMNGMNTDKPEQAVLEDFR